MVKTGTNYRVNIKKYYNFSFKDKTDLTIVTKLHRFLHMMLLGTADKECPFIPLPPPPEVFCQKQIKNWCKSVSKFVIGLSHLKQRVNFSEFSKSVIFCCKK